MPELPEVETMARLIRPRLEGRRIEDCEVRWTRTLGGLSRPAFAKAVVGTRLSRVWRRGKYLVFDLEHRGRPRGALVGHLRMTGRVHVESTAWDPGPYLKVRLALDDGTSFYFIDVRKFARLCFATEPHLLLGDLGPEPLSDDFTPEWLAGSLRSRHRALKPLLLDQAFLAGIGNIYADESLFRAGLHPLARSDRVGPQRSALLWAEIRATLAEAVAREGSSFDSFYRTPEGNPGQYQDEFKVYGRAGEPCARCAGPIVRIVVGQRGTHLCPRCQKR
ncbi:MAG: bifunctional DNA-formamidopyrimidine glycosylase/DNA-(apurinic or apyrimidinic site) lyase [Planctomycetota bacterium]